MRDDELRERLRDCNPWWRAATTGGDALAWVASDQMLRARAAYDMGYRSGLLDDVAGSGWRAEARVIEGKLSAGVVATRTILDLSNLAWALPAPVLALLLE